MLLTASVLQASERPALFAGSFYPKSPAQIKAAISGYLARTQAKAKIIADSDLIAIVVPHAGWIYSGQTAAEGFKAIEGEKFANCIFIGVDHRSGINAIGLWPEGCFATPLGQTQVDKKLNQLLLKKGLNSGELQHREEHSLEVLLPFFQQLYPRLEAVFISCGGPPQNGIKLGKILRETIAGLPGKTLLIVSTDWSHYHDAATAKKLDESGIEALLQLKTDELLARCQAGKTELCGLNGVLSAIEIFNDTGAETRLLAQSDSSQASGDTAQVVGYAAILIQTKKANLKAKKTEEQSKMNFEQEALNAVRQTLEAHLNQKPLPELKFSDPRFTEKRGIFVTLKKHGELRGCIGYIVGYETLNKAIPEMAISAATRDPRFSPVKASELNDLSIEISILSPMQEVKDISEIKIGRDGLLLQLGSRSGLLLPQVPVEWNWTLSEYLENLCYKAGLPPGAHLDPQAKLQRFSADVFGEAE